MSDVEEKMLAELRRIREALEGAQPLGFGKKAQPTYVFVRHHQVGSETYLWYTRDKTEGQNVPIRERDLTGYLVGVWRFDRGDDTTGEAVPKLNIQSGPTGTTSSRPASPPTSPAPSWPGCSGSSRGCSKNP